MTDLSRWIETRLEADPTLDDEERLVILAALAGDAELADLVGFQAARGEHKPATGDAADGNEAASVIDVPEPAGAFLQQLKVAGFRGIGPEAKLDFRPGPGLTVVTGRNGSGKSSFAEALEVALTGTTHRWSDKGSKIWSSGWRNLHAADTSTVELTLAEAGVGRTTLSLDWAGATSADGHTTHLQRSGQKRQVGVAALGWDGPLEMYRPMLSYDELGEILTAEPSKLYDALAKMLGLEQLAAGLKRLTARVKTLGEPAGEASKRRSALRARLEPIDDNRARDAAALLKKTAPDLSALGALATGRASAEQGAANRLRTALRLEFPTIEQVQDAHIALADALQNVADASDAATSGLELQAQLLETALRVHEHEGDGDCPVCGTGHLDDMWAATTRERVADAGRRLGELRRANAALAAARTAAHQLIVPTPSILKDLVEDARFADHARTAVSAWAAWETLPETDADLVAHLANIHAPALDALDTMQRDVRSTVEAADDAWTTVAAELGAYVTVATAAAAQKAELDSAKRAEKWLKDADGRLKNERLDPIATQAAEIWDLLRQESNVEIDGLRLEGSNTTRRAVIRTKVDDEEANGVTVLSQGELHALALALFLPRATMAESPFRFVVLDDPVQAMDPAKVDGLVQVLGRIAVDRQVIVFSHDNRFADAVRRASINAQVLEITRESRSRVSTSVTFDPPSRYLRDAGAIIKDRQLPEHVLRRVLPGMLRFAVEAQARDRYFGKQLAAGATHGDLERTWERAKVTRDRVSLAVYGDIRSLDSWLKAPHRRRGLGVCSSGNHSPLRGDVTLAHADVVQMVGDLRAGVK
ncbi:AAA family ATPase [Agromyces archimandritae]|uniref:Nuclease SbcCD subunit C n=1 Tax=Agromyces archimandritae TaxID=2781962 RepID=A0A975FNH7_9MICO|nr:AAA family ATPase [Agromyces archimandritae]QTX05670.1 AAA family ATPase [Agromyces archimandritae]